MAVFCCGCGFWEPLIETNALHDGRVGVSYSQTIQCTGCEDMNASGLPPGLSVPNSCAGTINGTPAQAGDFLVTVTVVGPHGSASKTLPLKIYQ